jgi:hypothetical protein
MKRLRKREHSRMGQQSQRGHGGVDVESRGKRHGDDQRNQFLAVEGEFHFASI